MSALTLVQACQVTLQNALEKHLASTNWTLTRSEIEEWLRGFCTDIRLVMTDRPSWAHPDEDNTLYFFFHFLTNGQPSHFITMAVNQAIRPLPDYLAITRSVVSEVDSQ